MAGVPTRTLTLRMALLSLDTTRTFPSSGTTMSKSTRTSPLWCSSHTSQQVLHAHPGYVSWAVPVQLIPPKDIDLSYQDEIREKLRLAEIEKERQHQEYLERERAFYARLYANEVTIHQRFERDKELGYTYDR